MKKSDFKKNRMPEGYFSVTPLPSAKELAHFYAEKYYQEVPSNTYQESYDDEESAWRNQCSNMLLHSIQDALAPNVKNSKTLLDVGCGEGFLLQAAHNSGFDVMGIDFSGYGVEKFHPDLIEKVRVGDAFAILDELLNSKHQFSVCVMQNVLEHVIDPEGLLSRLANIMEPDGVVAITVPNDFSSLQKAALEQGHIDDDFWFQPPQHLHYFDVDSLAAFCRNCHFEVVDLFSDFPIDFFLFHPGSNYVRDPSQGKAAHRARVTLDLLMAQRGIDRYLRMCRSLAECGVGRDITIVLRPNNDI